MIDRKILLLSSLTFVFYGLFNRSKEKPTSNGRLFLRLFCLVLCEYNTKQDATDDACDCAKNEKSEETPFHTTDGLSVACCKADEKSGNDTKQRKQEACEELKLAIIDTLKVLLFFLACFALFACFNKITRLGAIRLKCFKKR